MGGFSQIIWTQKLQDTILLKVQLRNNREPEYLNMEWKMENASMWDRADSFT